VPKAPGALSRLLASRVAFRSTPGAMAAGNRLALGRCSPTGTRLPPDIGDQQQARLANSPSLLNVPVLVLPQLAARGWRDAAIWRPHCRTSLLSSADHDVEHKQRCQRRQAISSL
jgi:hypothetical protein